MSLFSLVTARALRVMITVPALAVAGCQRPAATPPAAPLRVVQVVPVREGPAEPAIVASGVVANRDEARLAFKVGGVIASIAVREGDAVRRGQRLATIEAAEIDAQVAQANAAAQKAARDLERGRRLFAQDVVTREQLDDLATADAVARAQLEAAAFNRRYAEILAPDDGRVLSRLAEPRELVAAGAPVLVVGNQRSGVVLKIGLADRDALRVRPGDAADVTFDALPGRHYAARVREISQAADARSGTYRVELEISPEPQAEAPSPSAPARAPAVAAPVSNDAGTEAHAQGTAPALFSGLIGRARIVPSRIAAGVRSRVPVAALVEGDQRRAQLYRYDPASGTVHGLDVAVSFIDGDEAALVEPLPPGTLLVTEGAAYLREGETVRRAEPGANADTNADANAGAP